MGRSASTQSEFALWWLWTVLLVWTVASVISGLIIGWVLRRWPLAMTSEPVPVSVIRAYRVNRGDRPGLGAHLRTPSGVMYVSRLDGEAVWYIDTMFPNDDGPALHSNGWGERGSDVKLYPLGSAMCDALDQLAISNELAVGCPQCHSAVPLADDCAVCHRPLPVRG